LYSTKEIAIGMTTPDNRRFVFIGDGHGNHEIVHQAVSWAHTKRAGVVMLGDLTDSAHRTTRDQIRLLHLVLREMSYGATCLWGNHDLSYLFPDRFKCSGYSRNKRDRFRSLYRKVWRHENFRPFLWLGDEQILVTHAGLAPSLVPEGCSPVTFLQDLKIEEFIAHPQLLQPGQHSGGREPTGGITWLRKEESRLPLPGITQIVGHTPHEHAHYDSTRNTWYIDTLEASRDILLLNNGELTVVPFERYASWQTG